MPQPPRFPLIDGLEFAAAGEQLRGTWPVSEFPRLRDALYDDQGSIAYELRGVRDLQGRPGLALRVTGTMRIACRRCLEAVVVRLDEDTQLWLARTQAEIDAQPVAAEGPDGIVAGREMGVRDLVEDELLLALPYAPRHENCPARGDAAPGTQQSPFAGLRSMLRGRHRH
ncbi:MAG TPA: DUF177 domain-containing protein [Burkholderiales bacterium]|nr:DUF177 domain-containing protein [Burkholderiales bacterium]